MSEHAQVKRHAVAGVKWIGLSTLVTSAFQYLQVGVLTHFLSPYDFGLMAMAMVIIGIVQAFNDMGISNAIIQRRDTTRDRLSSLFWLEIMAGLGLFVMTLAITPLTVSFYREPALVPVMVWISTIFLITPPGQLYLVLLQRDLKFRDLAMIEIVATLISTLAMFVAAYAGQGVMALVIGQIVYYGVRSVQLMAAGLPHWRPHLHFRVSDLGGYIGFGLYQMGERTVTYLAINTIKLIIGRYLGADVLGRYYVAYQIIVYPVLRISTVIMSVSFPIMARFQESDDLLRRGYLHMTRLISFSMFPTLVVVFVAAPVFVPLLMGSGWSDVTPIVQILCVVALFKVLGSTTVPTYLSRGRADLGFIWNFIVAAGECGRILPAGRVRHHRVDAFLRGHQPAAVHRDADDHRPHDRAEVEHVSARHGGKHGKKHSDRNSGLRFLFDRPDGRAGKRRFTGSHGDRQYNYFYGRRSCL